VKTSLPVFLFLVFAAAPVQAASFDCVAPVFPGHSTSSDGVRKIEKEVRQWRACNAAHRSRTGAVEVDRLNTEVDASLAKWIAATRAYSNGQFNSHDKLTEMEREKVEYGMWMRGGARAPVAAGTGKL
jgi:hypothetical protein